MNHPTLTGSGLKWAVLLWLCLVGLSAQGQAPPWRMVMRGRGECSISAVAAGPAGYLYVVGTFEGPARLGNFTSAAKSDDEGLFVGKWEVARRRFTWVKPLEGTNDKYPDALAVQGSTLYVGGHFGGASARVGDTTLTRIGPGTEARYSLFVLKVVDEGSTARFGWVTQMGSSSWVFLKELVAQGQDVFLAGLLSGADLRIGSVPLTGTEPGNSHAFVVKLTDSGVRSTFRWIQQTADDANAGALINTLAVQGPNVYIGGSFEGRVQFGATQLTSLTAPDGSFSFDAYVAKLTDYGATGQFTWAYAGGARSYDDVTALAVRGPVLYAAAISTWLPAADSALAFGATRLSRTGRLPLFLLKMVDEGPKARLGWVQQAGGDNHDKIDHLLVQDSAVYAAGTFHGKSADFGRTRLLNRKRTAPNDGDAFVGLVIDKGTSSRWAWARQAGTRGRWTYTSGLVLRGRSLCVGGTSVQYVGEAGHGRAYLATLPRAAPAQRRRPTRRP